MDHVDITKHSGNKYLRNITSAVDHTTVQVDVYAVLAAFKVTSPALQHAAKKILCAGIRDKGSAKQDISEAIDALHRELKFIEDISALAKQIEHSSKS